ncbi:peptidoglycan bridge formation glycyltransferase FemA/FemB family protein, partial [Candidatus Parcubacteria bacterium]|nr:peptidoglycan bridge formation glycyltransferase FemA/FemB family protein [Candidatus Parcubacteria bacterium]
WEDFVLAQNPQSFLQSWNWGETNQLMEDKIFRLGFFEGERIVGTCLAIKQTARRGPHLIVPGGPLIDWKNKLLVNFVVQTLKDLARREKVWFVRVRPELLDSPAGRDLFANLGFTSAPMHLHAENTLVLDITPDEETLLRGMRKSTRYEIRKSLKLDLQFRQTTDPRAASLLKKLQNETVARHKFVGFPEKLFKAQLETFGQDKQAAMFTCQKDGEILAAAIIIFYGDCAYYHHSGSSTKSRKIPASHFLQWQIIREAKNRGCRHYNFWGIAPTDNPKHRFAGVTTFKKGFGGERIDWLHAHDLPTSPLYRLTYLFETIRRITRSL